MSVPFTLVFGTYTFPNETFQLVNKVVDIDTPSVDIRRRDGGSTIQGFLKQRRLRINGKLYGTDEGSVHNSLNNMYRSLHNLGVGASFYYMADRFAFAALAPGGVVATPEEGLDRYLYNMDIVLVSDPFVESITRTTLSGSRTNNSTVSQTTPGGNYPASPVFQFIAGTWGFSTPIYVENVANSYFFQYSGPMLAGQTLVIDTVGGCVLLHVGRTMVDAISYFGGNLDFILEPGGINSLVINAPTLAFTAIYRDRYYF